MVNLVDFACLRCCLAHLLSLKDSVLGDSDYVMSFCISGLEPILA